MRVRTRRERGTAELGAAVVALAVAAGAMLGTGATQAAVQASDGVTWLADGPTGQVIEVNPVTMRPQSSALVGAPGQALSVAQADGLIVVTNATTGEMTSLDLATLLASGRRNNAGLATSVLLSQGRAFLVDRTHGVVTDLDPLTMATRGTAWVGSEGIADVAVDHSGAIWVATTKGTIIRLSWSEPSLAFVEEGRRSLSGVGTQVRLVPHQRGVTLVSPETGAIVQVGTEHELVTAAPSMHGTIRPATTSESTLVPISVVEGSVVVLVEESSTVTEVPTAAMGCPAPGAPVVFEGIVYVPCAQTHRVIRLGPDGHKAGPDIIVPDGTPEVVIDDGGVVINVQGASTGVRVRPDGTTSTFTRIDSTLKPVDNTSAEAQRREAERAAARAKEQARLARERERQRQQQTSTTTKPPRWNPGTQTPTTTPPVVHTRPTTSPTTLPTTVPSTGPTTTVTPRPTVTPTVTPPAGPVKEAPVVLRAVPSGVLSAAVDWSQSGEAPTGYRILVNGSVAATVGGSTRSVTVTGLPPGTVSVSVVAVFADNSTMASAPAQVALAAPPGAPSGLSVVETARSRGSVSLAVTWTPTGAPATSYAVSVSGGSQSGTVGGSVSGTSYAVTLTCATASTDCGAGTTTVTVTPSNAQGAGPSASTTHSVSPTPRLPLPSSGDAAILSRTTPGTGGMLIIDKTVTVNLNGGSSFAGFGGVCTLEGDFAESGAQVACGASGMPVTLSRSDELTTITTHSVTMTAYDPLYPGTVIRSATFSFTERWRADTTGTCGIKGIICP